MQITCENFIFLSLIFAYVMNKDYFPKSFTKIICFDKKSKQNKINAIVMKILFKLYKQKSQNDEREKPHFPFTIGIH